jgi:hypothetical protein
MRPRRFVSTLLLAGVALSGLRAETSQMGVAEIRPGMIGVGRTVFGGTRVEEFRVHVLGVLQNVIGPRRNLILARLDGGPLSGTGVIAGMSGSPVYVDGRLIGAVSYALGAFSKEPIAGITPIAEMTDSVSLDGPRPAGARVDIEFPLTRDTLAAAFRRALNWNRPFAERPGDAQFLGVDVARCCALLRRPSSCRGSIRSLRTSWAPPSGTRDSSPWGPLPPEPPRVRSPMTDR